MLLSCYNICATVAQSTAVLFSREKDRTQKSRAFHARVLLRKTLKPTAYFMLILPRSHNPVLRRSRRAGLTAHRCGIFLRKSRSARYLYFTSREREYEVKNAG